MAYYTPHGKVSHLTARRKAVISFYQRFAPTARRNGHCVILPTFCTYGAKKWSLYHSTNVSHLRREEMVIVSFYQRFAPNGAAFYLLPLRSFITGAYMGLRNIYYLSLYNAPDQEDLNVCFKHLRIFPIFLLMTRLQSSSAIPK
jgi:hypothetical protein